MGYRQSGLILAVVGLCGGIAEAQAPTRVPAGATVFSMDITDASRGTAYDLEVDSQVSAHLADSFATGVWSFPAVTLAPGTHTVRARSCTDWGPLGGRLCSPWSATLAFESVVGTPSAPTGFRIDRVTVTLVP